MKIIYLHDGSDAALLRFNALQNAFSGHDVVGTKFPSDTQLTSLAADGDRYIVDLHTKDSAWTVGSAYIFLRIKDLPGEKIAIVSNSDNLGSQISHPPADWSVFCTSRELSPYSAATPDKRLEAAEIVPPHELLENMQRFILASSTAIPSAVEAVAEKPAGTPKQPDLNCL